MCAKKEICGREVINLHFSPLQLLLFSAIHLFFFLFYVVHQQQKINFAAFIHRFCRYSLSFRPKCRVFFSTLLNFLFYHFITEKHFPLCFCFVVDFRLLSLSPVLLACLCSIANSLSPTSNQHSIFSKVDKTFSEKIEFLQVLSFVEWILQLTFLLLFVSCFVSAFHSIKNNLLFAFLLFFMFKIHERKRKRFTRNFRNDACAQFIRVTFQFFVLDNVSVQQPFWFRDTI